MSCRVSDTLATGKMQVVISWVWNLCPGGFLICLQAIDKATPDQQQQWVARNQANWGKRGRSMFKLAIGVVQEVQ